VQPPPARALRDPDHPASWAYPQAAQYLKSADPSGPAAFTAPGGCGAVVGPVLVGVAFGAAREGGAAAGVAPPFDGALLAAAG